MRTRGGLAQEARRPGSRSPCRCFQRIYRSCRELSCGGTSRAERSPHARQFFLVIFRSIWLRTKFESGLTNSTSPAVESYEPGAADEKSASVSPAYHPASAMEQNRSPALKCVAWRRAADRWGIERDYSEANERAYCPIEVCRQRLANVRPC